MQAFCTSALHRAVVPCDSTAFLLTGVRIIVHQCNVYAMCRIVPPVITLELASTEGVQGSNLNLTCRGTGLPKPKYEFRKVLLLLPFSNTVVVIDFMFKKKLSIKSDFL